MLGTAFLAVLLVSGIRCGPSDHEMAGSVLIAFPVAIGLGLLLFGALFKRFQREHPDVRWSRTPTLVALGVCAVVAAVTAGLMMDTNVLKAAVFALWLFTASYLTMITLTWCVWVRRNPEAAFTWAWAPAVALQGVPAVLVATNVLPLDPTGLFWIWPGYFGVTTVGALVLAYVMAGRR